MVRDLQKHITKSYEVRMGKVPAEIQIIPEDFKPDDQELVGQMAGPINDYILQLNKILQISASLTAEFKTITVTGGAPLTFSSSIISPFGVTLTGWRNITDSSEVLTAAPSVQWHSDGKGNIVIDSFINLTTDEKYSVNLMIFEGVA